MDVASYLRRHTTVVFTRPREMVSYGAAFRYRKFREAAERESERANERRREATRAYHDSPDNPTLTALGRARLLAALNQPVPDPGQEPEAAAPRDRPEPPARS